MVRRKSMLALLLGCAFLFTWTAWANDQEVEARMRRDITFLASDECEGRGPGTLGIDKAADYIAAEFRKSGLKPAGADGGFFQPFNIYGASELEGASRVTLKGPLGQEIELKQGTDFELLGLSAAGKVSAPVVFVGFGATAKDIGYDDYKDMDVTGKIVIALRHAPRWGSKDAPFDGERKEQHASFDTKLALADSNKAAGVIIVNDESEAAKGDALIPFRTLAFSVPCSIPAVQMRTGIKRSKTPVKNVIGVVEGAGPLAKETVVVGAHYDHLGWGGFGSLSKSKEKEIHHGADDNGSGTTSVIELARRFGAMKDRQGRRLVFMTFSGEERGLLGSRHYCNREPIFKLDDTIAMVNLDMVGRLPEADESGKSKLFVEGTGTAKHFEGMIDKLNPGFALTKKPGGLGPSDHDSFYRKNIPVLFFWTGIHPDYHRPSDTSDKINVAGMRQICDFAEKVISRLATDAGRPEYVKLGNTFSMGMQRPKVARIGISPDYETDKEGVLVGSVSEDGPAAKAGMKGGDLIVEVAGKQVKNLNTYMVLMGQQQAGQTIEISVLRGKEKIVLKVVPK
ncbi:MAG: M28 family peptidase [Planctomycetes bacterium]|nr:M28 family peptidase [Planctomycetota bacterium]